MEESSKNKIEKELQFNTIKKYYLRTLDIGNELLRILPPPRCDEKQINHLCNVYDMWKNDILNMKSKSISALGQHMSDFFIYYNEGSDPHVELFWQRLKQENIPFKRVDKMAKILKRKKIKDQEEYDLVIDTMVPKLQQGEITQDEYDALSNMIGAYEERMSKGR